MSKWMKISSISIVVIALAIGSVFSFLEINHFSMVAFLSGDVSQVRYRGGRDDKTSMDESSVENNEDNSSEAAESQGTGSQGGGGQYNQYYAANALIGWENELRNILFLILAAATTAWIAKLLVQFRTVKAN